MLLKFAIEWTDFLHHRKFWFFRLESEPNRKNRNRNLSVPISKKNRSVPIFLELNFQKNRGTEPIGLVRTERPAWPLFTHNSTASSYARGVNFLRKIQEASIGLFSMVGWSYHVMSHGLPIGRFYLLCCCLPRAFYYWAFIDKKLN